MTVASETTKASYSGDGATVVFSVPFYFLAAADLAVTRRNADGTETLLALTTDYSVSGAGNPSGGSITCVSAPASGTKIFILRAILLTQGLSLPTSGPFPAKSVEQELDALVMELQRVKELVDRRPGLMVTTAAATPVIADPAINAALMYNSDGTKIIAGPTADQITGAQTYASNAGASATAAASSATAAANYAAALTDASATSTTIGTGAKTFTVSSGKQFAAGQFISIVSRANNANFMHGQVTSYSGASLAVNVLDTGGSGTFTDWNVSVSGSQGSTGATGATGATGTIPIAAAAGTVDAITAAFSPALTLTDQQLAAFVATGANATTAPTFAPNGLAAKTITKSGGRALAPGDISGALAVSIVEYNLANTRWELLNPATVPDPWIAASGTADAITATYSPAIPALYDGLLCTIRATAANATTTPTFAPNGLTARTITKNGGFALAAGDIPGNLAEIVLRYNLANTRWELLNLAQTQVAATSGFKSLLRNATNVIASRGTSGTITAAAALAYSLDGWMISCTGANVTWSQATNIGNYVGAGLLITGATGNTDVTVAQRIESLDVQRAFPANSVQALTFQVLFQNITGASLAPTLTVKYATAQDNFTTMTTDLNAVSLSSVANNGLQVISYTWTPSSPNYTNGIQVSLDCGVVGNAKTIQFIAWDLRATPGLATGINSSPPTPELAPFAVEKIRCARFFQTSYPNGTAPGATGVSYLSVLPVNSSVSIPFPVQMRAAPTISFWDSVGAASKMTTFNNAVVKQTDGNTLLQAPTNITTMQFQAGGHATLCASFGWQATAEL